MFDFTGVAMGLTNYLVDAEVPRHAAAWVQAEAGERTGAEATIRTVLGAPEAVERRADDIPFFIMLAQARMGAVEQWLATAERGRTLRVEHGC